MDSGWRKQKPHQERLRNKRNYVAWAGNCPASRMALDDTGSEDGTVAVIAPQTRSYCPTTSSQICKSTLRVGVLHEQRLTQMGVVWMEEGFDPRRRRRRRTSCTLRAYLLYSVEPYTVDKECAVYAKRYGTFPHPDHPQSRPRRHSKPKLLLGRAVCRTRDPRASTGVAHEAGGWEVGSGRDQGMMWTITPVTSMASWVVVGRIILRGFWYTALGASPVAVF
ncbi:hypothetical protein B0H13DRAFT_1056355 [Mycena leptocephala]|nr:hypothetical protein B0H13DRAFT_1927557 [Mycena leptocephala]KAJ7850232.1 hypothetical protein B0H13DRAFT_2401477 [Mycena leptocephala]KAJ7868674.1 hypothetical protein B0H13DRAFT_1056355 [Mycena leptocephala]